NLVQEGDYCLAIPGEMYIVFLRNGMGTLNLENLNGTFSAKWFDPRNGGFLQTGTVKTIQGGGIQELVGAPSEQEKDWVILLRKE
ncbi:MAG TPA: putative collagen-binding domain-containing protein, partial [Draconibacterium sp.]|nr:putative collagen-binding domain-containing protein [Draconibacterium sp.]